MDRGAWRAAVCGVTKSQTLLTNTSLHLSGTGIINYELKL